MITINISGFLTDFTGGRSVITIDASPATIGDALSQLWQMYPGVRDRVLTERGEIRRHVNIFLDDENIRRKELLETELPESSEITILPSVSGGLNSEGTSRIGTIVNGLMFTLPRKSLPGDVYDALSQRVLDSNSNRTRYEAPAPANLTNELLPQPSITEHTTHHLKSNKS
ncbi:MAG TPA: ubiquitin-like small modifier protein 1 [Pyrinomonadaceae bacterium]|nr:ubiquitin-like small modifier protein 1 [Pyrinomonadaceae bacterium]